MVPGRGRPGSPGYPHPDSPWTKPGIQIPFDPNQSLALLDDLGFVDQDGDGFRESPDVNQFEISWKVASNLPTPWLPELDWEFWPAKRPEPGDLIVQHPGHSFHGHLGLEDILHYRGLFHPPPGAKTLLATADGGAVLYIDRVSTPGTLLVTSLDMLVHIGRTSNPVAERFLDRFPQWVVQELL